MFSKGVIMSVKYGISDNV